jgi:N-acylglucosamine 2-epimerase
MNKERILELKNLYKHTLLNDVVPFWMLHAPDQVNGGFYHYLDRDGSIVNPDKSVWVQGRATWLFSKLYHSVEKKEAWLQLAESGYNFMLKHCFDQDGRMFFQVTADGKPLRKRRYWYSETFAIMAFAEYSRASGNKEALQKAKDIYRMIVDLYTHPGSEAPKVDPQTRPMRSHAETMILISTSQTIREVDEGDPYYDSVIDRCLDDLFRLFVKRDKQALLETVGSNGEIIDTPQGRCINPGHAIESAWFVMQEGERRKDSTLINNALEIIDWSFERGWDPQYGGLFSFVDLDGKPPEQLEWDMKFWWPHNETLYALLLAYQITGDNKYADRYERTHEWTFKHFPDPEYGEWYGYLHRDGSVAMPIKGSVWKGPFHLPRHLLLGWRLLEQMEANIV